MRSALLVLLCLFGISAEARNLPSEGLMAVRLQSFEVVTHLLSVHNPDLRGLTRDEHGPSALSVYRQLPGLVPQEVAHTVAEQVNLIEGQLEALDRLPAEDEEMLASVINPILSAHHLIDQILTSLGVEGPDDLTEIDQLSLAMAQLGLLYQTRLFMGLMVHAENHEGDVMAELDAQIMILFARLQNSRLKQQPLFRRSLRNYIFVRSAILDQQARWVPNAAQVYLNDAMRSLVDLRFKLLRDTLALTVIPDT